MTDNQPAAAALPTGTDRRRRVIAAGIGNFIEWFDFAIYGFFAVAIGANFFPSGNATASLLSTLAVFGVAFLMRPIGGLVIGSLGDRRGRRFALMLSVLLMGTATALIALLPNHASIGVAAPVLLVVLRCAQGFSAGGEWTSSTAFLVESAPSNRRGVTASVMPMTAALALVAGASVALIVEGTLPADAITSWGWRVPFVAAFPIALVGLYLRIKLEDTKVFQALEARGAVTDAPIRTVGRRERRTVVIAFALSAITVLGYYYIAAYAPTYLSTTVGMPRFTALGVVAVGALIYAGLCPLMGTLSDRVGRRPVNLLGGTGLALLAVPAFVLMATGSTLLAVLGLVVFGLCQAMHISTTTVMLIELFPAATRSTGSAIAYNLGAALVAGPGPMIAAALAAAETGLPGAPALYLTAVAAICTVMLAIFLPETRLRDISPDAAGSTSRQPVRPTSSS